MDHSPNVIQIFKGKIMSKKRQNWDKMKQKMWKYETKLYLNIK